MNKIDRLGQPVLDEQKDFTGVHFKSSPGSLVVDLRCKCCGAKLPLPPADGKWQQLDGTAPEPWVWALSSARKRIGRNDPREEPIVLSFTGGRSAPVHWRWMCRGTKGGRDCPATIDRKKDEFERLVDERSKWDQTRPLVVNLG